MIDQSEMKRLVAISNRLPIVLEKGEAGWNIKAGSGGLVTALAPVLRSRGGLWIGWPGTTEELDFKEVTGEHPDYGLVPVQLTEEDVEGFYDGFSNEIIWPLFHDLQDRCNFEPRYWDRYLEVNRKFAEVITERTSPEDYLWVQDYHLMHVAQILEEMEVPRRTGFFLHIPFPPPDIFLKLPWRDQVIQALLEYSQIGFQTLRDRHNFLLCLGQLCPEAVPRGRGNVIRVHYRSRIVTVGNFPISISFKDFSERSASREVSDRAWFFHEAMEGTQLILGVDRLDYTKGIPQRLEAFRTALRKHPHLLEKVTFIQVVVPSRAQVPEYQTLKAQIERLVGEINGEFSNQDWVPIHYYFRHLSRDELVAYYRTCEIALVTPLKDGMNLVAKEYCACNVDTKGVLILSEFAGAAPQLHREAIMVNPYDREGVADAINQAFGMEPEERQRRMKKLRQKIKRQDIFWWVDSFLRSTLDRSLDDFPLADDLAGIDPDEGYLAQGDYPPESDRELSGM